MPQRELERIKAVSRFLHLQFSKEQEFQGILKFAAESCGTSAALITLIDKDTQHILFNYGFGGKAVSRAYSFCSQAIEQDDIMVVPDTRLDERFKDNPNVVAWPNIRFYAGTPLVTSDGFKLGSLCIIDPEPKRISFTQRQLLRMLARQVINLLEFESGLQLLKAQVVKAENTEFQLRSYFESSPACHLLMDPQCKAIAMNKALQDIFFQTHNISLEPGITITDYVHPSFREAFLECCKRALAGESVQTDRYVEYANGAIYWHILFHPATNPEGKITGISFNATDITQTLEHERTILMQHESLQQIAFLQSHELRKPVANILGLLQLISMNQTLPPIPELDLLQDSVEELDGIIREIVKHAGSYNPKKP